MIISKDPANCYCKAQEENFMLTMSERICHGENIALHVWLTTWLKLASLSIMLE